ncbi:MAG: NnrU family protein, partial [Burkholderiales bacterium]|nr:NnrU family protein [Burkholderiales bacterium]
VAAAYVPTNYIKAAVGHPMVAGVKLWAFAHLMSNGTLADVLLFGSFLAWAIADFIAARRRDRLGGVSYNGGTIPTVVTVLLGVVLWAAFAFWLHRVLIGVAPFGR